VHGDEGEEYTEAKGVKETFFKRRNREVRRTREIYDQYENIVLPLPLPQDIGFKKPQLPQSSSPCTLLHGLRTPSKLKKAGISCDEVYIPVMPSIRGRLVNNEREKTS
jgi:hypothetical protein